MKYLYIGLAALLGGFLRIGLDLVLPQGNFPMATLICNIISSFLLVLVYGVLRHRSKLPGDLITAMGTGTLGTFSTISSFANATLQLAANGMPGLAAANFFANLLLCFGAALAGVWLNNRLNTLRRWEAADE